MSFDWEKFVDLADSIQQQTKAEEVYRTAISRAYYGAFCKSRDSIGFKIYTKTDVHSKVSDYFKKSTDLDDRKIGQLLDALRKERNKADYNGDASIGEGLSRRCIVKAKEILKLLPN
jgi:uncharacterized protein (UPF0332 family)